MTATLKVLPAITARVDTTVVAGSELWGNRIVVNPTNQTLHFRCVSEIRDSNGTLQKSWEIYGYLDAGEVWNKRGHIYIPTWASSGEYTYVAVLYNADTGDELDECSVNFTVIGLNYERIQ